MMGGHKRKDFFFLFVGFEIKKITPVRLKALRELAAFSFFFFSFLSRKEEKSRTVDLGIPGLFMQYRTTNQPTDRVLGQVLTHN
jgi:uncharacterized protein YqhQ